MKGQILTRELSTGDYFIFAKNTKNLYLIEAKHVKEWQASDQSSETLRKMLKNRTARRFTAKMLEQLRTALSHIDFKI